MSRIQSLRAYQKCIDAKDLGLQDCINICQAEDAVRMQVLECRPVSVKSMQSAQTVVRVHRLQNGSTVGHRIGPGSIQKYARLRTILVLGVARKDTLNHCAEVLGHPYT